MTPIDEITVHYQQTRAKFWNALCAKVTGLDADLSRSVAEDQTIPIGLAKFYYACVHLVTVTARSAGSNDSQTFSEAGITLRLFRMYLPYLLYLNLPFDCLFLNQ